MHITVTNRAGHNIHRWKNPVAGALKCIVNATLFSEANIFGYGVCVRDATGLFIHANTAYFDGVPSPVEVYGLFCTLRWLMNQSYQQ